MSSGFRTPAKRGTSGGSPTSCRHGGRSARAKAVDLVTGKTTVEYFFDPSLLIQEAKDGLPAMGFKSPSKKDYSSTSSSVLSDPIRYASRHLFVPCTIIKSLSNDRNSNENYDNNNCSLDIGPTLVKTADGALHKIQDASRLIALTAPDDYLGMSDILDLANITEASLLHTLRLRYKRDDIYTSAGPILISINPYKPIVSNGGSLYSDDVMMEYRSSKGFADLEPHLFAVADRAYTTLMGSVHSIPNLEEEDAALMVVNDGLDADFPMAGQPKHQSIIISGESGAGKTYIMQYLARITKRKDAPAKTFSPDGRVLAGLEDRVLSSNPLLETFGNAQTLRNDNSSRFGKYIQINFSTETGAIVNASISNYLLEKTRITTQMEGERNYHIFYQLFAGAGPELLQELGFDIGPESFAYLGNRVFVRDEKSKVGFDETVECLSRIGLAGAEQTNVFKVAAAVLHIGNISFHEHVNDNGEHIANISEEGRPSLKKACDLLGLDCEDVAGAILTKLLVIGGKTIKKASTVAIAEDKRDAMAKMTYSSLFLWLVKSVNETLNEYGTGADQFLDDKLGYIGVLDIYGFESFEHNGYEQMLINYCNEKLQRHFNRHLFEVEQNLYSSEGVDWTYITFNDNRPCLELIEGGGGIVGILNTLDDAWGGMGSTSEKDANFVQILHKLYGGKTLNTKKADGDARNGHDNFITPKFGNDRQFIVVHYAGEVRYTADGFVEKNMESLSNEMRDIGESSTSEIAKMVYTCGATTGTGLPSVAGATRRSSIRGVSVAAQFKLSLQSLVDDLEQTQPHYIRCIKPNLKKAANALVAGEVLKQLRYSGMMEAIRIRREGYALREDHVSFYNRFSVLLTQDESLDDGGIEHLVSVLSKRLGVSDTDWQIGHSKIFLRRELSEKLERLATLRVHAAARTVGRFGKSVAIRRVTNLLVAWARFRLVMLKVYRKRRAGTKIGAAYRTHTQMRRYRATRQASIKIQATVRRNLAVQQVRKLKDPFYGLTFKDLKRLLRTEASRMEKAANDKDFKAAAELEVKLQALKDAVEAQRPETRAVVEKKIDLVQKKIDDALRLKAYSEAAPLQDELEALFQKRSELPTLDELKGAVEKAEAAVSQAARNRDFALAAELQLSVDDAKQRLAVAMATDEQSDSDNDGESSDGENAISTIGVGSRAELESEISGISRQIEEAIDRKDFKQASTLQATLEEREKLRTMFPSCEELQVELQNLNDRLKEAVAKKEFAVATDLQDKLLDLEKKVQAEQQNPGTWAVGSRKEAATVRIDGAEKVFETRHELESEIRARKCLLSDAIASKEYKDADLQQSLLDALEELKKLLPTISELKLEIEKKNAEINNAISERRFADADSLHKGLDELEKNLQKARLLEPEKHRVDQDSTLKGGDVNTPALHTAVAPVVSSSPAGRTVTARVNSKIGVAEVPSKLTPSIKTRNNTSASSVHSEPVRPASREKGTRQAATVIGKTARDNTLFHPPKAVVARDTDDVSDVTSVHSSASGRQKSKPAPNARANKLNPLQEDVKERPVAKLRPKKPLISSGTDSILTLTKMLVSKRGDASLVVNTSGGLAGIITDTDITRRVVARHLDPSSTAVSQVMTPNPTCVSLGDSAMDAMSTMLEHHFRHLPVVDENGSIVGLLDIAKCLNDAINRLELSQSSIGNPAEEALKQAVGHHGAQVAQAAALQALLGPLIAQAFDNQASPSLRSILAGKPSTVVSPHTTVLDTGMLMAECRKAALVVDDNELVGIFGFKDMMTRVISEELSLEKTKISMVMTPNPESVPPDTTVVEALQVMHENKFLTLPVCEHDGTVVGLLDVMDVIHGCGGSDGWRSVFSCSLQFDGASDTASLQSGQASAISGISRSLGSKQTASKVDEIRPVSKLRPKKPLISYGDDSILSLSQMLSNKRMDASLVVNKSGGLAGIITDTDITRRVVAKHMDPSSTAVSQVMTPSPTCVSLHDSAIDALSTMVENHFRHLPVVDESGTIVGLLDIAKCLNDAVSKLEKSGLKSANAADEALKQVVGQHGAKGAQATALEALLGPLMSQAFGTQASPSLHSILGVKPSAVVAPHNTVLDAGMLMAEHRRAALVVDENKLVGTFDFNDMMTHVIAKELSMDQTEVSAVMAPSPESVPPEMTVLEALQFMHENKILNLPVCKDNGFVLGLVNVMDLIHGCGGAEGWRSIFSSSLDCDDASETASLQSGQWGSAETNRFRVKNNTAQTTNSTLVSKLRPKKPLISYNNDSILTVTKMLSNKRGDASIVVDEIGGLAGIITDTDITCRVVARHVDPASTDVSHVMTLDPTCVSISDSAMDAMSMMVENHFRHLPVVGETGSIVGLLDIAKCLNDAITKLEKSQLKGSNAADEALKQVVSQHRAEGAQAAALKAVLGPLMAQAFGNQSTPILRSILAGKPSTVVHPETTVLDAGMLMAERRKAALVVQNDDLVGIFGFKDMMTRAIAKELPLEQTEVASVMTPSPETVSPDVTVLEALQVMHEDKLLTLPVCEENGTVVGLVDVMDVIHGCGGVEGWRSILKSSLELDDVSEASSIHSGPGGGVASVSGPDNSNKAMSETLDARRPVSKLRPKKPLICYSDDSILTVTQMLASKRSDASLVVDDTGGLAGIITDTDITRRVIARHVEPFSTNVSHAMTPNPICVSLTDSAMDALSTMVENHFRHLPVVDERGSVVGLLDIAKCLNDAISKLERSQSKGDNSSQALRQALDQHGAGGAQASALQALLGPLMSQAFGDIASPTLRSLLAGKPSTTVSPDTMVLEAGIRMAECRKAALVVEDGALVGIFAFKDLMSRVVSKELPPGQTQVKSVMTPSPESVSPDITVLEALQVMHENKFLTLPVCEKNGAVVGIVDVMDVIYGCGGTNGWRSVFSSSLDLDDNSDASSVHSGHGNASASVFRSTRPKKRMKEESGEVRPVSALRPKKPLISYRDDSILTVAQMLSNKRGDASLIVDEGGGLAGIVTDTDMTRRVVARHIRPSTTNIAEVMTPNPTCVSLSDTAVCALSMMVDNHFRHLPVVDDTGSVVGLLDIAKCLNDALRKLMKSRSEGGNAADEALKQVVSQHGASGAQAAALQALLGPLMAQAFGHQSTPALRSILAGKPSTVVTPETTVLDAGMLMAEHRQAALVVQNGELVGIFGFKDMMTRAIAKELPLEQTEVASVMTPSPETVPPDVTVLEALQVMHEDKLLTLPVCEENGTVMGLVDVMDVIHSCGGVEGWRSILQSSLDMDDISDEASMQSGGRNCAGGSRTRSVESRNRPVKLSEDTKPVSKLRPKKPLLSYSHESVLGVTKLLASKRGDAALIIDEAGCLAGIITDTDFTRRVVARHVDPSSTNVSVVMTPNPTSVSVGDSAIDALSTMVENRFRHLPVVGENGSIVGLLDIAKCLNDAISKLERSLSKRDNAADEALKQAMGQRGAEDSQSAALRALLGPLMAQAFGGASQSLQSILKGKATTVIAADTTVLDAGMLMAEHRKAALVVEDNALVGIFGFKDMMTRVIAKELSLEHTYVSSVMTPDPEAVTPEMSVLEALQIMHENKFLTLPVCEHDGRVLGVVDVMDVICACGGSEGWKSVFGNSLDFDDLSDSASRSSGIGSGHGKPRTNVRLDKQTSSGEPVAIVPTVKAEPRITVAADAPFMQPIPGNIPRTLEFKEGAAEFEEGNMSLMESRGEMEGPSVLFKIVDSSGNTYRIRAEMKLTNLQLAFSEKVNCKSTQFSFVDDEGDSIVISSDADLKEAVNLARAAGNQVVKLTASMGAGRSDGVDPTIFAAIGVAVGVAGLIAMVAFRPKR